MVGDARFARADGFLFREGRAAGSPVKGRPGPPPSLVGVRGLRAEGDGGDLDVRKQSS